MFAFRKAAGLPTCASISSEVKLNVDGAGLQVDLDQVAILQGGNRSTGGCFWADMPDTHAARSTRETSIRHQGNLIDQSHSHQC